VDKVEELNLKECVKRFIKMLDKEEESDSGKRFRPNYITSCRIMDSIEMGKLLKRMEKLANE